MYDFHGTTLRSCFKRKGKPQFWAFTLHYIASQFIRFWTTFLLLIHPAAYFLCLASKGLLWLYILLTVGLSLTIPGVVCQPWSINWVSFPTDKLVCPAAQKLTLPHVPLLWSVLTKWLAGWEKPWGRQTRLAIGTGKRCFWAAKPWTQQANKKSARPHGHWQLPRSCWWAVWARHGDTVSCRVLCLDLANRRWSIRPSVLDVGSTSHYTNLYALKVNLERGGLDELFLARPKCCEHFWGSNEAFCLFTSVCHLFSQLVVSIIPYVLYAMSTSEILLNHSFIEYIFVVHCVLHFGM